MDTIQGNVEQRTNDLELLFSLELHYQGPIELAPIGEKVGQLVGGGDGIIQFEGREFAMPISDGSKQWRVAGVLRFKTDDSRYAWLNETFALTSGTFDYESGMARWTAFVPRSEAGSNDQGGR